MANADACLEVLNFLEANHGNHNQRSWAQGYRGEEEPTEDNLCGTTLCAAGAALLLNGEVRFERRDDVGIAPYWLPLVKTPYMRAWQPVDDYTNWVNRGARLLGLNEWEANYLFLHTNNESALEALRRGAKGERIIPEEHETYKFAYPHYEED
jgi:hypothetical protein